MTSVADRCDMTSLHDALSEKTWHSLTEVPAMDLLDEFMITADFGYVDDTDLNKGIPCVFRCAVLSVLYQRQHQK